MNNLSRVETKNGIYESRRRQKIFIVFIAGDFGYVKSKSSDDIVYLKCKYYKSCDGIAKINLVSEMLEQKRGCKAESFSYLSALETMRKIAQQLCNHTDKFTTV